VKHKVTVQTLWGK